jgi:HSP20 family molecular chaperone IbpA
MKLRMSLTNGTGERTTRVRAGGASASASATARSGKETTMAETNKDLKNREKQEVQSAEGVERIRETKAFVPNADILETDDAILLRLDMPGVQESDIDITLEKNVLTLRGEVRAEPPEGYSLSYREYETGDYERSFSVSDAIDQEKIEAAMENGVLTLTLPKAAPAKTRRISVTSG